MGTKSQKGRYLSRAGLYFGILGVTTLLLLVIIFQEDWTHRYTWMIALIPLSLIFLFLASKIPYIGGALLIALGVATLFTYTNFKVGIVGQVAGVGLGHTVGPAYIVILAFLPFILSGVSYILSARIARKPAKKDS